MSNIGIIVVTDSNIIMACQRLMFIYIPCKSRSLKVLLDVKVYGVKVLVMRFRVIQFEVFKKGKFSRDACN